MEQIPFSPVIAFIPEMNARLHSLLDQQECGVPLALDEREEAKAIVHLAERLTIFRLRLERQGSSD
jgi:hypothetical protein